MLPPLLPAATTVPPHRDEKIGWRTCFKTGRDSTDEAVARFRRVIDRADGYIMLTAEYNHGYPAVLKNALDSAFVEWRRKPVACVGWGNAGGARAIEQLRAVAVEFKTAPLRHAVHMLPEVFIAFRHFSDPADLTPRTTRAQARHAGADDLARWMLALASARGADG